MNVNRAMSFSGSLVTGSTEPYGLSSPADWQCCFWMSLQISIMLLGQRDSGLRLDEDWECARHIKHTFPNFLLSESNRHIHCHTIDTPFKNLCRRRELQPSKRH